MSLRRKLVIFIMGLALVVAGCTTPDSDNEEEEEEENQFPEAADFTLTSSDGTLFNLSDFEGDLVVVDFFFVDCSLCAQQVIELHAAYENHSAAGLRIISVDVLPADDSDADINQYRSDAGLTGNETQWFFARDTDNVSTSYEDAGLGNLNPYTILINAAGRIVWEEAGITDYDSVLKPEIELLLQ